MPESGLPQLAHRRRAVGFGLHDPSRRLPREEHRELPEAPVKLAHHDATAGVGGRLPGPPLD